MGWPTRWSAFGSRTEEPITLRLVDTFDELVLAL
jgi:hypothetical protein